MEKISLTSSYKPTYPNLKQSIKKIFFEGKLKLKTLLKDVFEKSSKSDTKYISRGIPNSVGSENDIYNCKSKLISFYEADIEKMSKMNEEEAAAYRQQLVLEGKYFYS